MTLNDRQFNNDGWRYETRMKNKPNSQGTLFSGGTEQRTPESRQPRGYSPERFNEVAQATNLRTTNYETGKRVPTTYPGNEFPTAQLLQTYARSTIPVEHFNAPDENGSKVTHYATDDVAKNNAGEFRSTIGPSYPTQIRVMPKHVSGYTPIHEVGHHVSLNVAGTEHSKRMKDYGVSDIPANWDTSPRMRGMEEGFADNYAQEHARNTGYKPKPVNVQRQFGAWHNSYFRMHNWNASVFDTAYNSVRPNNQLSPRQFTPSTGLPKEHIEGQIPLLQKNIPYPTDSEFFAGVEPKPEWSYDFELNRAEALNQVAERGKKRMNATT